MQSVIVDAAVGARFHNLSMLTEVRDESGQVLGHFLPASADAAPEGAPSCPYTDEEIEVLRQQTGGRPLAEIWRDLDRRS
jgi:hypothetical protein